MDGWQTYTPDGRMLEVEHQGGEWIATCDGVRATGTSAHAAISEALGSETRSIGAGERELSAWVEAHAAQLQAEVD